MCDSAVKRSRCHGLIEDARVRAAPTGPVWGSCGVPTHSLCGMVRATVRWVRIVRTFHFREEQRADDITEAEIALAWTRPELERESQDHRGAWVRTATVPGRTRVTVVGRLSGDTLILITTWRH